jgi:hypothetical protein
VGEWPATNDGASNRCRSLDVDHHDTDIEWQSTGRNNPPEHREDELLLRPLRVLGRHNAHFHCCAGSSLSHSLNGQRLVVFDCYDDSSRIYGSPGQQGARHDRFGSLDHHPIVGSQERLTLAAVDQHRIDRPFFAGRELDVGGKCGSSHPHDTGGLDGSNDLLWSVSPDLVEGPLTTQDIVVECLGRERLLAGLYRNRHYMPSIGQCRHRFASCLTRNR